MPKLICYGGVGSVTGANFVLEVEGKKYMVDCGLPQGIENEGKEREPFPYDPKEINTLFVTHAHIDHIGLIPKLVKNGFEGTIFSTNETREIAELMLADMAKINIYESKESGVEPIYGTEDVFKTLSLWKTINYHEVKEFDDFSLELFDAGHILGSAMYRLTFKSGKSLLFSGDLGNSPSPLLRKTEEPTGLNYMVIDSVYGDRVHEDKLVRDEKFKEIIKRVSESSGTLLIPAFSLERTQVLLYLLDNLFESKEIKPIPVFLDSPLAIRVTEVYERVSKLYNETVQGELKSGDDVFKFSKLVETAQVRNSKEIENVPGPKIIIAGSGMSTAGRILNHEEAYLPDSNTTILFIGYQAPGTLGRMIEEGVKRVTINDHEVDVRAKIEKIDGYSAHADSDALTHFVSLSSNTLEKVFVAMGEMKSSSFLAQRIRDELGVKAIIPEKGKEYDLGA